MAEEIMANAFNQAIREEAEKADKKRKEALASDKVPGFTQPPVLGEKDASLDKGGVNAVKATAPPINLNPEMTKNKAETDMAAPEAKAGEPNSGPRDPSHPTTEAE